MGIEGALRAVVLADAAAAALIGERFFPFGGRQGAEAPYVTYQRATTLTHPHLSGPSNLDAPLFQLNAIADEYPQASELADALVALLDGSTFTVEGFEFSANLNDRRDMPPEGETRRFGVSLDFYLWHERA